MPTQRKKQTPRRVTKTVADERENYEEKLSPEAIRALNSQYGASRRPPYLLYALILGLLAFSGYMFWQVQNLKKSANTAANNQANNQAPQARPTELKIKKPGKDDHWKNNTNARYVWVEYSDLECPFCKKIHPDLVKLLGENKDTVAWVYRHFPLPFHQNAQKEAEATECAYEQGGDEKFWDFADKIYERTTSNGTGFALDALTPLATEIGLDADKFKTCLDSNKYAQKVKDQQNEGSSAGVQATPTGVIYDMKTGKNLLVEGALPYDSLKQQLDTFISQNK